MRYIKRKSSFLVAVIMILTLLTPGVSLDAALVNQPHINADFTTALLGNGVTNTVGNNAGLVTRFNEPSAIPSDPDGVAGMNGTGGGASFQGGFDGNWGGNVILNLNDPNSVVTIEMKYKSSELAGTHDFFLLRDTGGFQTGWIMRWTDSGQIQFNTSGGAVQVGNYTPNEWVHMFMILRGNATPGLVDARVFVNGVEHPGILNPNIGALVNLGALIRNVSTIWGYQQVRWDDFIVRTAEPLTMLRSTIPNGAVDVPVFNNAVELNFNMILDESSFNNVRVYRGLGADRTPVANPIISRVTGDATRLRVEMPNATLEYGSTYEIVYTGLQDVLGSSASGSISFTTFVPGAPATLIDSTPAQNGVSYTTMPELRLRFSRALSAASIPSDGAGFTLNPATTPISSVILDPTDAIGSTLLITFDEPLEAGRSYTLTIPESVTADDGGAIGDRIFRFSVTPAPDRFVDDFRGSPRTALMYDFTAVDGALALEFNGGSAANFLGDDARFVLGNQAGPSSIIYKIDDTYRVDGIPYSSVARSFRVNFFLSTNVTNRANITLSHSIDGVNFTTANVALQQYTEPHLQPVEIGYTFNFYEVTNLPQGTQYVKVTMSRPATIASTVHLWHPQLSSVEINHTPVTGNNYILRTSPAQGGIRESARNQIEINYAHPAASLRNATFSITQTNAVVTTPISIVNSAVDSNGMVTLSLSRSLAAGASYTVTSNGVRDWFGRLSTQESFSFTIMRSFVTVESVELRNATGAALAGNRLSGENDVYYTPMFNVRNSDGVGHQVTVIASVFENGIITDIRSVTATVAADSSIAVSLDGVNRVQVTNGGNAVVKMFAIDANSRPISQITFVDNNGTTVQ